MTKPTPAAMRAATALQVRWMEDWSVDVAKVIDRETGLPELLRACREAFRALEELKQSGDEHDWEAHCYLHDAYRLTKAAIAKAERETVTK